MEKRRKRKRRKRRKARKVKRKTKRKRKKKSPRKIKQPKKRMMMMMTAINKVTREKTRISHMIMKNASPSLVCLWKRLKKMER
jgi:hypothetical protein